MNTQTRQPPQRGVTQPDADHDKLVRQAEVIISNVLRGGVLLSAAIILLGVALFYIQSARVTGGLADRPFPTSLGAVGEGLLRGDPIAIVACGLLVLLVTPVVRVAVSIIAFALEHDRLYVFVTTLVLVILLISFILGKAGA